MAAQGYMSIREALAVLVAAVRSCREIWSVIPPGKKEFLYADAQFLYRRRAFRSATTIWPLLPLLNRFLSNTMHQRTASRPISFMILDLLDSGRGEEWRCKVGLLDGNTYCERKEVITMFLDN